MSSERLVERLRRFLLAAAGLMCLVTPIELALTEHYGEPAQWIPFILCGLGLVAVGAVWFRPQRLTIWLLRGVMMLMVLGSGLGLGLHLLGNYQFEQEIRPSAAGLEVFLEALKGANPLLAPGILALAGLLALAATTYHPALRSPAS